MKGITLHIRKIAAVGGIAIGATLAFAPLASADVDAADPAAATSIASLFDSEVSSLNSQFELDALFAGDSTDVTKATAPGVFDTIAAKDIPYFPVTDTTDASKVTTFEDEIYGANPIKAGISMDTGPFNLLNGSEAKFDDAYNVAAYAVLNHGALDTSAADYIGNLPSGFGTDTPAQAFEYFYNFAVGDLGGFFQTDLSSLDISAQSATELFSLLGSL